MNKTCGSYIFQGHKILQQNYEMYKNNSKTRQIGKRPQSRHKDILEETVKEIKTSWKKQYLNWVLNNKWDFTKYSAGKNSLNRISSLNKCGERKHEVILVPWSWGAVGNRVNYWVIKYLKMPLKREKSKFTALQQQSSSNRNTAQRKEMGKNFNVKMHVICRFHH